MRLRRSETKGVSVDLTPMIDVVFQLILFFLVSTTFAVLPGIGINLPESTTAQNTEIGGITITATESGKLFFNDEKVTYKTLETRLASFDTEGKKKDEYPVTLEADDKVTNGTIVHIFDILRASGFVSVNLRTTNDD